MSVSPGWKSVISLPAASFAICSFSISLSKFMANSPSAAQASRRSDQAFDRGAKRVGRASTPVGRLCHLTVIGFSIPGENAGKGRPQVRPPFAGEPFGLGAAPSGDLGVIARDQDLRDRPA